MTNRLARRSILAVSLAAVAAVLAPAAFAKETNKQEKQAEVRKMADGTLNRLAKVQSRGANGGAERRRGQDG